MKTLPILFLIALLALALVLVGCNKNDDDDDDDDNGDDDDDDDDTSDDDDDDTVGTEHFTLDLDLELRGQAHIDMAVTGNNVQATFKAKTGFDIIAQDTELTGAGSLYWFDGQLRMVALKFVGPAVPGSPCANDQISYSVTLSSKMENTYVSGGFVAYCGDGVYTGQPAQVYRLSGFQKSAK